MIVEDRDDFFDAGWDSNPRIHTKQDPKPCTFDLAVLWDSQ